MVYYVRLALVIILTFVSCRKEVDDLGFKTYVIPEGEHSSGNYFNHPTNSRISFDFRIIPFSKYSESSKITTRML